MEKLTQQDIAERLGAALGGAVAGLTLLTGGASMETWAFELGDAPLILRRRNSAVGTHPGQKPPLALEAEVIAACDARGVPVPGVVHVCTDADGLGEGYVMQRVAGETLGKRIATDPAFGPARAMLARQCGVALAGIHATPPLSALARVDVRDTLANYQEAWRAAGPIRPTIEAAFRWLESRIPDETALALVHGDFRNGNIMVAPDTGLVAVLDWELAHVGDPAEDMGWLCTNSWRFGRPHLRVGGFGEVADLLAGYQEAGGAPISAARVDFWTMVGSLKWAVMTTMMYARWRSDPSAGPERAVIGRRLSETEADIVAIMARTASQESAR
jgi:aminoglycoside phosphotransferase (APT) family kinase protein